MPADQASQHHLPDLEENLRSFDGRPIPWEPTRFL